MGTTDEDGYRNYRSNLKARRLAAILPTMSYKHTIFVTGPSASGKSFYCDKFKDELKFIYFDLDKRKPEHYGIGAEWDEYIQQMNPAQLASIIQKKIAAENSSGAVVGIPNQIVLSRKHVEMAKSAGIAFVILWGTREQCKQARRSRTFKKHGHSDLDEKTYDRRNKLLFDTYGQHEFDQYRIENFAFDGSFMDGDCIFGIMRQRITEP